MNSSIIHSFLKAIWVVKKIKLREPKPLYYRLFSSLNILFYIRQLTWIIPVVDVKEETHLSAQVDRLRYSAKRLLQQCDLRERHAG